jgi:hypothetical protein
MKEALMAISNKRCLICCKKNDTVYHHVDKDTGALWLWCNGCGRGYSIEAYCHKAGISLAEYLKGDFAFQEAADGELRRMEWPIHFYSLSDPRSEKGVIYLNSRGLTPEGDLFYDAEDNGIVLPLYYHGTFVGAQVRFIEARADEDGKPWKVTTLPGTRLGLLVYGFDQQDLLPHIKGVIVCEGALNALSIQQSLNKVYGGAIKCPWKAVACSGSGASEHQQEVFKNLKERGYKVVIASDNDDAGMKMLNKYVTAEACTHFALTDTEVDWNDELQKLGSIEFAKYFFTRIKSIYQN